jgi:hypothetical protein
LSIGLIEENTGESQNFDALSQIGYIARLIRGLAMFRQHNLMTIIVVIFIFALISSISISVFADNYADDTVKPSKKAKSASQEITLEAVECKALLSPDNVSSLDVISQLEQLAKKLESEPKLTNARTAALNKLLNEKVSAYFEGNETNFQAIDKSVFKSEQLKAEHLEFLRKDILEIFNQFELLFSRLKKIRQLENEELIFFKLVKFALKELDDKDDWILNSSAQISLTLKAMPELTLGELSQAIFADLILFHVSKIDKNALEKGKIKYLGKNPKLMGQIKFLKKRAKNTYANHILWSPVYLSAIVIYVNYKDQINAMLGSLF